LSRILCPGDSLFALKSGPKGGVELIEGGLDGGGDAAPASGFELRDGQTELELQGVFGMEVAAAVAPQDFKLAVDGLNDVGGGQRAADTVGVVKESQVMISLFTDLANKAGGAELEVLAEVLELGGGDR
jgi:hypothetical protein